jgi:phosphomannomutase
MDLGTLLNKIDEVLQAEGLPYQFIKGGLEIRLNSNVERDEKMAIYQQRLEAVFARPGKKITVTTSDPVFGSLTVQEVLTKDGVKVKFTDLTNGLLRKSGTEPLIKVPTEASSKEKADILFRVLTAVAMQEPRKAQQDQIILQDKELTITISWS